MCFFGLFLLLVDSAKVVGSFLQALEGVVGFLIYSSKTMRTLNLFEGKTS